MKIKQLYLGPEENEINFDFLWYYIVHHKARNISSERPTGECIVGKRHLFLGNNIGIAGDVTEFIFTGKDYHERPTDETQWNRGSMPPVVFNEIFDAIRKQKEFSIMGFIK